MIYKRFVVGALATNCYLLTDEATGKMLVIDPGAPDRRLLSAINKAGSENLEYILLTHGHFDHIGGVEMLRKLGGAKLAVFGKDATMIGNPAINGSDSFNMPKVICRKADIVLKDGDTITLGDSVIEVIATPGHTAGGCCYYCDGVLYSGDTMFFESCGRCDLPTADQRMMRKSLKKLADTFPDETKVFSGHGMETTIGHEKEHNPYLVG